jgi:putative intracellular protease/amidase
VSSSKPPTDPRPYAAFFLAGGHGAMWEFPKSESLRAILEALRQA